MSMKRGYGVAAVQPVASPPEEAAWSPLSSISEAKSLNVSRKQRALERER
jgi:hypothetical protein